jgi:hypothetical protein
MTTETTYSIIIPFTAKCPTQWHPTTPVGPFARLTRGAFASIDEVHEWAAEHLASFHQYTVLAVVTETA